MNIDHLDKIVEEVFYEEAANELISRLSNEAQFALTEKDKEVIGRFVISERRRKYYEGWNDCRFENKKS